MTIEWKLEKRKISALKFNEKNPRRITKQKFNILEKNIERQGFINKPVINQDNTILSGHQRVRVLKRMKHKDIEVWVPDRQLNEKECTDINLGMNLSFGEFDYEMLANEFEAVELLNIGFTPEEIGGFTEDDIDKQSAEDVEKENESSTIILEILKEDLNLFEKKLEELLNKFPNVIKK